MTIDTHQLSVVLNARPVLENVTISVHTGEFVALVGPNGAGKTTLIRSILGLLTPESGKVTRHGRLGYVPQKSEMDWRFPISVRRCVANGRAGLTHPWQRDPASTRAVQIALQHVELEEFADRPIAALSGGQRQRVLVARALASEPNTLILDEPFTGVDMPTQELLISLFQRLAHKGASILMSTHDLGSAMDSCTRVILLNRTVRADALPSELKNPTLWMETFNVGSHAPILREAGISLSQEVTAQ